MAGMSRDGYPRRMRCAGSRRGRASQLGAIDVRGSGSLPSVDDGVTVRMTVSSIVLVFCQKDECD